MAGTLGANIAIGTSAAAPFAGDGGLTADATEAYPVAANFSGEAALDTAQFIQIQNQAAALAGGSALGAAVNPVYSQLTLPRTGTGTLTATAAPLPKVNRTASFSGAGGLTATMVNNFTPFTVTTNQTNAKIPAATGCYLTMAAGGGDGGYGYSGGGAIVKGGGGGGGAGGRVARTFIPIADITYGASTYSLTVGGPGAASRFWTAYREVRCDAGLPGSNGGNNSPGQGGDGRSGYVNGFTVTLVTGGDGGDGATSGNAGLAPNGGGGGGLGPAFAGSNNGGLGNGQGGDGGTGQTTAIGGNGTTGGNAVNSTQTGAGGGGGGGGGNPGGAGGSGGAGAVRIEWV